VAAILQVVGSVGNTVPLLDLNDNPAGIVLQRGSGAGSGLQLADVQAGDQAMPIWSGPGSGSYPEATSRHITVPVHLMGATADAVGVKVQTLARLVGQPWVLRVRRSGGTVDGWIRCYPTIPQMTATVTAGYEQVASGVIDAVTEPYAYGGRVDAATATVPLVDASAAGAFILDVPNVTGDAPTPALVRTSSTALVGTAHGTLVAVRRTGAPTNLSGLATQAEAAATAVFGSGVTVSTLTGDAALSGGGGVRYAYTAAYNYLGGTSAGRITYTPALTGAEAPGLYKLLVRARRSTADEYTFYPKVAGLYALDSVLFPQGGSNTRLIDLGIIQLPAGQPQQLAAPVATMLGATPPSISIDLAKTGGVGTTASNLDLDYFLLVPADEDLGVVYQSAAAAAGTYLTLDGFAQDAYLTSGDPVGGAAAGVSSSVRLDYVGGIPRLYPGATVNRLFLVGGLSAVTAAALASSAAFTVSYWPRYTWLP
jgi:hypothetical protein